MRIILLTLVHSLVVLHLQCLIPRSPRRRCPDCPGVQDMEKFVEAVQKVSTFLATGAFSGGAFKVYLEQCAWTAADPTNRTAIGGTMASAPVTDGTL